MNLHPAVQFVLNFFAYEHLPPRLQEVSKQFHDLAQVVARQSENAETVVALRKLLEAKDAAVRAVLVSSSEECRQARSSMEVAVEEAAKKGFEGKS